MKRILVYGSLRPSAYNFKRMQSMFGEDALNFLGNYVVSGYTLHSLGVYPAIVPSKSTADTVSCDLLECTEECFDAIHGMELGAGYKAETVQIEDQEPAIIYVYRYAPPTGSRVYSGDWLDHLQKASTSKETKFINGID